MQTAGIKEFKNKLSRYLAFVKNGEDVLISERGKVIARVVKEEPEKTSLRQALHPLIMKGLITFPIKELNRDIPEPVKVPGKPVSEMVTEGRR
ncbi:MAG: type II toxin-antitoxin system prevent-host-death family antitoxin [Deltaproteobacteria bacterium]|nr:type II toxin-antitoxin system prevent-host-death family antitoxin [Deltaproteobacteria bacterium]MBW2341182.1 type II toxin-antitoxin system prevent-host-death family antitoxin [Deltaproteobacteria bacterium]